MTEEIHNAYQTLELPDGGNLPQVQKSWREMVTVWHPDRFPNNPNLQRKAEERTKQINNAYDILKRYLKDGEIPRPRPSTQSQKQETQQRTRQSRSRPSTQSRKQKSQKQTRQPRSRSSKQSRKQESEQRTRQQKTTSEDAQSSQTDERENRKKNKNPKRKKASPQKSAESFALFSA